MGFKDAGSYISKEKTAYWDGKDSHGQDVASGVYFYQIKAGGLVNSRKMVLLK
jgi:hypothetical protein